MPNWSVRSAAPSDGPAVERLFARSYPVLMAPAYEPAVMSAALPLITRSNPSLLAGGTFYVAVAEGEAEILACGGWTAERPGTGEIVPGLAHLRHFASDPEHLRSGLGRAIFETCRLAASSDARPRLEVYASLNSVGFYAAMGFCEVRRLDVALGPDLLFPAVAMVREPR